MVDDIRTIWHRNLFKALARGDFDEAVDLLAHLRDEDPLSVQTRGLELEYLYRSGQYEGAERLSRQLLELFPDSPRILYLSGRLAYTLRDYQRAEQLLSESHRQHPNRTCRRFLGKTLTQLAKYDQAESILLSVLSEDPNCHLDLAWLYERREDPQRALEYVHKFLTCHPENQYALTQKGRIEGRTMEPSELVEDLDNLAEHGEPIPDHLLAQYVENLFRMGRGDRARQFLGTEADQLGAKTVLQIGWVCYKLQAHDMAFELFVRVLDQNRSQQKFLSALEAAAHRCGRLPELAALYEKRVADDPRFYGRLQRVRGRMA